jgi:hypothetical protein
MNNDSSITVQGGCTTDHSLAGSTVASTNVSRRNSFETITCSSPETAHIKPDFGQHVSLDDMINQSKEAAYSDSDDNTLADEAVVSKEETIDEVPYCIFSRRKKWGIVIMAAVATFISPLTANIFLPAMNSMQEVRNSFKCNPNESEKILTKEHYLLPSLLMYPLQKCKLF